MTTSLARGHTASLHEHALLCAAQGGDRRAQEELLHRYEPLVRHTVRRLQPSCRADSDDIAQEAWLGLLGAIRAWQPGRRTFPAFAARCVHNKTANALSTACARKHQVLSSALSLDRPFAETAAPTPACTEEAWNQSALGELFPAPHADPASTILVREQLDAVRAAWPTLSAKERAVLAGVLGGRSYRQLAVELACTVKSIDHALRRARRKLAAEQALAA